MTRAGRYVNAALVVILNYPGTVFFTALGLLVSIMAEYAASAGVDPREVSTLVRAACLMFLLAVPVCLMLEHYIHAGTDEGGGGR